METPEVDPNFEPQTRARSYTWPHRPQEVVNEQQVSPASEPDASTAESQPKDDIGSTKKTSSRRNAWGNLSYADLITKAIEGSPEKRLTLSQIYDWMVQNVPYFKDKGDSTSSAGWKNSIRHNLSLHSRFMRIQNEGTGKSSWWVINPDAKLGKTPRRRACSMETKMAEKKRGRIKKRVDQIRAAMENSQSTSGEDYLDGSPIHSFQLSPEIRPRTTSNASSCGRLSPIQAGVEPDMHDSQVPPMSPIPWASETDNLSYNDVDGNYTDQLVDTLVDGMKLAESNSIPLSGSDELELLSSSFLQSSGASNNIQQFRQNNFNQNNSFSSQLEMASLRAPPPYPDQMNCSSSDQTEMDMLCSDYCPDLQTTSNNSEPYDQSQQLFQNSASLFPNFNSSRNQQQGSFLTQLQNVRIKTEDKMISSRIPSNQHRETLLSSMERQQTDSVMSNGIHQTNSAASQQQNIYSSDHKNNISSSVTLKDLLKSKDDTTSGTATEALLALLDNAENCELSQQQQQPHLTSPVRSQVMNNQLNTSFDNKGFSLSQSNSPKCDRRQISPTPQISPQQQQHQHQVLTPQQKQGLLQQQMTDNSILRAALTQKPPAYSATSTPQTQNVYSQFNLQPQTNQSMNQLLVSTNNTDNNSTTLQNLRLQQQRAILTEQLISLSQQNRVGTQFPSTATVPQADLQPGLNFPVRNSGNTAQPDFDVDVDSFMMDDIQCDVDQVIKHELSLEGNLDFNFDSVTSSAGTSSAQSIS